MTLLVRQRVFLFLITIIVVSILAVVQLVTMGPWHVVSADDSQITDEIWQPPIQTSWQMQFTDLPIDQSVDADLYIIDLFDTTPNVVAELHAQGRKVVCYMNAGAWEAWRPDAQLFPSNIKGQPLDDWPDEQWLDIRDLTVLGPIIEARLDLCKAKGFDGVDSDNVDGYANDTGFPLKYEDQINFNMFLSNAAHSRGLAIGLKNDIDQIEDLHPYFEWALSEECFHYDECEALQPFIANGKPVFHVEYDLDVSDFCPQANEMNFNSIRKNLRLDAYRVPCRHTNNSGYKIFVPLSVGD